MIERITAPTYKTSDGEKFEKLSDAQQHELELLFPPDHTRQEAPGMYYDGKLIAAVLMQKADIVSDILSTTSKSKPRARAINGGTKKRTPKQFTAADIALK